MPIPPVLHNAEPGACVSKENGLPQVPFGHLRNDSPFTRSTITPQYINANHNPVIVFAKYEIANGAAGEIEFEIGG